MLSSHACTFVCGDVAGLSPPGGGSSEIGNKYLKLGLWILGGLPEERGTPCPLGKPVRIRTNLVCSKVAFGSCWLFV